MHLKKSLTILLISSLIISSIPYFSHARDDQYDYSRPSTFDTTPGVSFDDYLLQQQRLNTYIEQKNLQNILFNIPVINPNINISRLALNWSANNYLNQRLDYSSFNVDFNEQNQRIRSFKLKETSADSYTITSHFSSLAYTTNNNLNSYHVSQRFPSGAILNRTFYDARYKVNPLNLKYSENLQEALLENDRPTLINLKTRPVPEKYLLFEFKEDILRAENKFLSIQIQHIEYNKKDRIASYEAVLFDKKGDNLLVNISLNRGFEGNIKKLSININNNKGFEFIKEFKASEQKTFQEMLKFFYKNWIPILGDETSWIKLKDLKLLRIPVFVDKDGKIPENLTVYDICKNVKQKFDPHSVQEPLVSRESAKPSGFFNAIKSFSKNIIVSFGRLFRSFFYMVTGKWDDVQDFREKIRAQAKEKPTALFTLIKDKDIKDLSLSELRTTHGALSQIPKEQVVADDILCGNTMLKPRRNDKMELIPIPVKPLKDTFKLTKPIRLEERHIPEGITFKPTDGVILSEAFFSEKAGTLHLQEGIIETTSGKKYYLNNLGLIMNAQKIIDNFTAVSEKLSLQKTTLLNIDKGTLKNNIAQFNLLFGKDVGELQLNESDLSFIQSLAQKVSDIISNLPDSSILSMRSFLTENANVLHVITESARKIEIAQSALSDFQKRINELSISIGQTPQELSPDQFEIVKDKISELDYIACQLVIDELTKMGTPFVEGAVKGDFIENPSWQNIVGQIIGGLNPADIIADLRDFTAGWIKMINTNFNDGKFNTVCASIGFIPWIGNGLKLGLKSVAKTRKPLKLTAKSLTLFRKVSPETITKQIIKSNINDIQKCTIRTSKGLVKYYVKTDGTIIPAKGYRYISSKSDNFKDILKSKTVLPNKEGVIYFSFDKFDNPKIAKSKLQIPTDLEVDIRLEFSTEQALDNIKIPFADQGKADYLEPFTLSRIEWGEGWGRQAIATKPLKINKIIDLKTNKILKELP